MDGFKVLRFSMFQLRYTVHRESEISTMVQFRYIVQRIRDQYNGSV